MSRHPTHLDDDDDARATTQADTVLDLHLPPEVMRAAEALAGDTTLPGGPPQAPVTAPAPGTTLAGASVPYRPDEVLGTLGDFDLLQELGHGGMGVVYKGFSRRLGRFVAIKVVRPGHDHSPIVAQRFVNEAMLAARLTHPYIVNVYTSGEAEDGTAYFVMEFVEGRDLGVYLKRGLAPDPRNPLTLGGRGTSSAPADALIDGKLTVRRALELLEKAARAVHYAHEHGVVHRDIKPDNILVDDRNLEPHLTDFGVAKAIVEEAGLTRAGEVMGTPHYMSPEQANGELRAIGPRSDVYSLGATLYHVLTGRTMFDGESVLSVLYQVLHEEPVRPSQAAAAHLQPVPLDLETICLVATSKDAARRYESAAAFADELRRYLDGEPILARPVGRGERLRRTLARNRPLLVGVFVVLSLLFTMVIAFGVTLIATVDQTSDSLRELDKSDALSQAETLERAIVVNMLQGRADLARDLASGLAESDRVGEIAVVRLDRTPAYTDARTRRQVEARISRPGFLDEVRARHPEFVDEIEELKRRALPSLDARPMQANATPITVDDAAWRQVISSAETVTYEDGEANELVVLKPIENREACTLCHGDGGAYGAGSLRAVLVVRRPLGPVQQLIAQNTRTTWVVGGATVAALLVLVWICARVFGIGLPERSFGIGRKRA